MAVKVSDSGGGRLLRRFVTKDIPAHRELVWKAEEWKLALGLSVVAGIFPSYGKEMVVNVGIAEASAGVVLLALELTGAAMLFSMMSERFAVLLVDENKGEIESELFHFGFGAFISLWAAIAGGVQIFWTSEELPDPGNRALGAFGAFISVWAVLAAFKLLLALMDRSVSYAKLQSVAFREGVNSGKATEFDKAFLNAVDNPEAPSQG